MRKLILMAAILAIGFAGGFAVFTVAHHHDHSKAKISAAGCIIGHGVTYEGQRLPEATTHDVLTNPGSCPLGTANPNNCPRGWTLYADGSCYALSTDVWYFTGP